MKKRKISTINKPLLSPDGTVLKNMRVAFILVDENGRPCDTFDYETGERIAGNPVYVKTNSSGEFEVELFPNTRGTTPTFYLVRVLDAEVDDFTAALQDGDLPIDLLDFKYSGVTITPAQYDLVQKYLDEINELLGNFIDDESTSLTKTWSSNKIYNDIYQPSRYFISTQETPSNEWLISHNLNRNVIVNIFDNDGDMVVAKVSRIDMNTVKIDFSEPVTGEAFVR